MAYALPTTPDTHAYHRAAGIEAGSGAIVIQVTPPHILTNHHRGVRLITSPAETIRDTPPTNTSYQAAGMRGNNDGTGASRRVDVCMRAQFVT